MSAIYDHREKRRCQTRRGAQRQGCPCLTQENGETVAWNIFEVSSLFAIAERAVKVF